MPAAVSRGKPTSKHLEKLLIMLEMKSLALWKSGGSMLPEPSRTMAISVPGKGRHEGWGGNVEQHVLPCRVPLLPSTQVPRTQVREAPKSRAFGPGRL